MIQSPEDYFLYQSSITSPAFAVNANQGISQQKPVWIHHHMPSTLSDRRRPHSRFNNTARSSKLTLVLANVPYWSINSIWSPNIFQNILFRNTLSNSSNDDGNYTYRYTNAPQYYFTCTLLLFFSLRFCWRYFGAEALYILRIIRHPWTQAEQYTRWFVQRPMGVIQTGNDGLCNMECRTAQGRSCFGYLPWKWPANRRGHRERAVTGFGLRYRHNSPELHFGHSPSNKQT